MIFIIRVNCVVWINTSSEISHRINFLLKTEKRILPLLLVKHLHCWYWEFTNLWIRWKQKDCLTNMSRFNSKLHKKVDLSWAYNNWVNCIRHKAKISSNSRKNVHKYSQKKLDLLSVVNVWASLTISNFLWNSNTLYR